MSLKWTSRGAVLAPATLQIRLSPHFPGRVAAGAPWPARSMADDEVDANVRLFATPGPRGRPISGLVLSGLDRDVTDRIAHARALGVARVVVHAESGQVVSGADVVTVAVRSVADAARVRGGVAVVPLEQEVLARLADIVAVLDAERIVLTWPFPVAGQAPPPRADAVVSALAGVLPGMGREVEAKGIPRCVLAGLPVRVSRTSNRWYVDADHQRERALLFVPDVLQLAKREACRFCTEDPSCDGVAERWLELGLAGPLLPLRAPVRTAPPASS